MKNEIVLITAVTQLFPVGESTSEWKILKISIKSYIRIIKEENYLLHWALNAAPDAHCIVY